MSTIKKVPEIDELLGQVWSRHVNLLPELEFLHSVFSFFNRRTTYLAESENSKNVVELVNKYINEAKNQRLEREKEREKEIEREKKWSEQDETKNEKVSNESVSTTIETTQRNESDTKPQESTNNYSIDSVEQTNTNNTNQSSEELDVNTNNKKEWSEPQDPVNNGGTTDKYVWTQTLHDLEVRVAVPSDAKGRDLNVVIEKRTLSVGVKGKPTILNGALHDTVTVGECLWTLDHEHGKKDKTLTLSLKKEHGMYWWTRVLVGDPEIDTSKIEPDNSQLEYLDPETRQTVERMMVQQKEKIIAESRSK